ncbi:MAG: adenylyl-sulfate kinase [Bryobacteraceae bacterium]
MPDPIDIQLDLEALAGLELFLSGALAPDPHFRLEGHPALEPGARVLLRDPNNVRLAEFTVERVDGGAALGPVALIEPPRHADFAAFRPAPAAVRERLVAMGAVRVAALAASGFLTVDDEAPLRDADAAVLHIVEGGPVDHFPRVRAAQIVAERYLDPARVILNVLPPLRTAWRDRVLRNYGATCIAEPAETGAYRPEVAALAASFLPPPSERGFCVWFTGLPSSGKSTIADRLALELREAGRRVTMLDGDVVRMHLSKGLGFSREDRDTNIRRIGWVASEIVRHHGIVITAAVSPYAASRDDARRMVGDAGFVLVYVSTPAEICEQRDVKGFYARARAGQLTGFTGVDDPYEPPPNADLVIETAGTTPESAAAAVWRLLRNRGYVS